MKQNLKISVVVCTYNREKLLSYCLQSLVGQVLDRDQYEIIVVNNNSTDGTQKLSEKFAEQYSNIRVLTELHQGLSHSRNRGWQEAQGEYVAYIDDDARAEFDWCERVLQAFKNVSPTPVAVGGQIRPWYEAKPPAWFSDEFEVRTWGDEACFLVPPNAKFGFSGSNMAFPRKVLERYGGFSPQFGMVGGALRMGEDTELFCRIHEQEPFFWYDPAIRVAHWVPVRNMKVSWRFCRSFKCGESQAYMFGRRVFSLAYVKKWIWFFVFLLKAPASILIASRPKKTALVRWVEALGGRLGFLLGRVRS